jgi:hypothetical protein
MNSIGNSAATAAGTIRDTASDVADHLPDVATAALSALEEVDRGVQAGSDEFLAIGSAVSFGVAMGLFLGGSNRLFVLSAFVPVVVFGLTLLGRSNRSWTAAGRRPSKATTNGRGRLQDA